MTDDPSLPPPPPPITDDAARRAPVARIDSAELRALQTLSTAVIALVSIVAVVNLASIPNDLAYIGALQDVVDGDFSVVGDIEDQEDLRSRFGIFTLGAMVVTGIVWVIWQHRARRAAERLGAGGQRHSTLLANFGWVIPFANLFIPKHVTDDLWRASDPDGPPAMRVEGRPVWSVINLWWGLWLVGAVLGRLLLSSDEPETIAQLDGYITNVWLGLAATLLLVVAAVPAVLIVNRITARLRARAGRYGATG